MLTTYQTIRAAGSSLYGQVNIFYFKPITDNIIAEFYDPICRYIPVAGSQRK